MATPPTELASLEAQLLNAFRAGYLKGSWDSQVSDEAALTQSDTGAAIERLQLLALECAEPVSASVKRLALQLKDAYREGFAKGRTNGVDYEGLWETSDARKALYFEPKLGMGLCPGNLPKVGERWFITRDDSSTCQTVDVLDVTSMTALVKQGGTLREERVCLDRTRFIELAPLERKELTLEQLKQRYADKLDTKDMHAVIAEAKRLSLTMDDNVLKCVLLVLAERTALST